MSRDMWIDSSFVYMCDVIGNQTGHTAGQIASEPNYCTNLVQ